MSGALVRASFWGASAADLAAHFQERRQEAAGQVVPFVRPSVTSQTLVTVPRRLARLSFRGNADFTPALFRAQQAAIREAGRNWWMSPAASIWARVPASWVSYKGRTRSSVSPRDMHFPLGRFWPGGELPVGPEYAAPISVAQWGATPPRRRVTIDAPAFDLELVDDAAD